MTSPAPPTPALSEENRALVEREVDVINLRIIDALYSPSLLNHLLNAARAEARAPSPKPGSEPVAWRYLYPHHDGSTVWRTATGGREINGSRPIKSEPLYTHPAPASVDAGAVERLTEEAATFERVAKDVFERGQKKAAERYIQRAADLRTMLAALAKDHTR